MVLEATEDTLAELFGKSTSRARTRVHTVTHLQRKWLQALPAVNRYAIQAARVSAFSYRDFFVGAAAYCYCSRTGELAIFNSGNLKLHALLCKFCAEMSLRRVIPGRFDRIIGISIYGEEVQPDPSGHAPRTLHPCPPCRNELEEDPRVAQWTRMFMFRPWMPGDPPEERAYKYVREHMSFRELLTIHRQANGNGRH